MKNLSSTCHLNHSR